jgi:hypothetical protein
MAPGSTKHGQLGSLGCAAGISWSGAAVTFLVRAALPRPYTFVVMSLLIALLGPVSITTIPPDIFQRSIFPWSTSSVKRFRGDVSGDVLPLGRCAFFGIAYSEFSAADREAIVAAYPRTDHFKEDIIQTFYEGIKHKPETTFGNVKADVLTDQDPKLQRMNFCSVIRGSQWKG